MQLLLLQPCRLAGSSVPPVCDLPTCRRAAAACGSVHANPAPRHNPAHRHASVQLLLEGVVQEEQVSKQVSSQQGHELRGKQ